MLNLPNMISASRIPLALLFLMENPLLRSIALIIALITDGVDGYLARRNGQTSRLGTLLDPITDKFFVIFVGAILIGEGKLSVPQICMLISRDFAVLIYGTALLIKGELSSYRFRAIWCGKVTTVLQFALLMAVIWNWPVPAGTYAVFVTLGVLALVELYLRREPNGQENA